MIKDAVNVSRIFSHTELKQKFIEVSNTALNLQKRNDELEREIRQLREQQDLRHKIERTTDGYFNKSVDKYINLTNRLLRRFYRGFSNDLENVRNSLLCVIILSNNPCQKQR